MAVVDRSAFDADDGSVDPHRIVAGSLRMEFLWFLIIGAVAGWLAGLVMKGRGFGLLGNLVVGIVGAMLGGLLFGILGLSSESLIGSLITATVGAVVLLAIIGAIKKS